uniref:THAP domain-containing protein 9 n=1 Tax=Schizaphis graminum TaxID=13262 RepID=A0A2S2P4E2_SCHGA
MAIRKQITYLNGRVYGCVDLGTSVDKNDQDNFEEATSALVFLAVCLNGHWKVPLGYFLIHSLSGSERGNLLKKCLELFNDTGAKCHSITLDGASCNMTMCTSLGANFDYYSPNFKPWIKNPGILKCSEIDQPIYIFWDAAHMIKLVRNTLGDKKIIVDQENKKIKWSHIVDLLEIQNSKGLHSANKLKKTHVRYYENKMNVRLAAQTLSSSVSSSLKFCEHLNLLKETNPTAIFCEVFNDAFDITNCRNKLAKGNYYLPINNKTLPHIKQFLDKFKSYVENLRYEGSTSQPEGELLLKSQRKTGFLGLIICITNLINLFEVVKRYEMSYILGYKLSQDHLEVFFSAMRSRGGYNNNPNSVQFKTAYKRLLVRHEIKSSEYGNCSVLDTCSILFVGTAMRKDADAICDVNTDNNENLALFDEVDHDYYKHLPALEEYVVDIVKYTSGFIVFKTFLTTIGYN